MIPAAPTSIRISPWRRLPLARWVTRAPAGRSSPDRWTAGNRSCAAAVRVSWLGLRYLEWRWDPDPADNTYRVDYSFLLRERDGSVTVEHDHHVEGLFARADWLAWFEEAGLPARGWLDSSGREIFIGTRRQVPTRRV